MDPKWMLDYIRVIDAFPVTDTQKILVRPYKREHFNIERNPWMEINFREWGENAYKRLTKDKFMELTDRFIENGRMGMVE